MKRTKRKKLLFAMIVMIVASFVVILAYGMNNSRKFETLTDEKSIVPSESTSLMQYELKLKVNIPCPGHGGLIKEELYKLEGVTNVVYQPTYYFMVYYDPERISEKDILGLTIFDEYEAKKI